MLANLTLEKFKNRNRNGGRKGDNRYNKQSKKNDPNTNFTPELKVYPSPEWKRLSKENQAKVRALYLASNQSQQRPPQGSNNSHHGGGAMVPYTGHPSHRNVSQVGYYAPPIHYPNDNMYGIPRAIGQISAPAYQHGQIPPHPPPIAPNPSSQHDTTLSNTISGNAGDIGQYFDGYANRF